MLVTMNIVEVSDHIMHEMVPASEGRYVGRYPAFPCLKSKWLKWVGR
jgi:hypothetical protein